MTSLRPDPGDEGPHGPGPEQLWGESWYFDAVSDDGTLGVWVRLGLYPNLGVAWYTALVCGPDRPTVAVVDYAAPLPTAGSLASGAADHVVEEPLQRMRVTFEGTGAAYADPADVLRRLPGTDLPVALDLVWETDGTPYQYRITTRYEIPCRVSGTVRVGDEVLSLSGPGQRDHSWGLRDWWALDWVWSAGRLDDGTRFHAVDLRLPEGERLGVGYLQDGAGLVELEAVGAVEEVGEDGLPTSAQLTLSPGGLVLDVVPRAFGPLLLDAPDGRVSHFPRAMCDVTAADGRRGTAWLEWNLNQRG